MNLLLDDLTRPTIVHMDVNSFQLQEHCLYTTKLCRITTMVQTCIIFRLNHSNSPSAITAMLVEQ